MILTDSLLVEETNHAFSLCTEQNDMQVQTVIEKNLEDAAAYLILSCSALPFSIAC